MELAGELTNAVFPANIRKIMMKIIRYALWKGTIDWSWSDNPAFV